MVLKTMLVAKSREDWRKCRLCMRSDVFLIFLFENSGELTNLAKAIKELLQYEVSRDDRYPSFACCNCSDKLWEFKDFKEKCDNAKKTYESILSDKTKHADSLDVSLSVKKEPDEVKEEASSVICAEKWETSENDLKKCISLPKLGSVKEEENLPESPILNYEVFIESITANSVERGRRTDTVHCMQVTDSAIDSVTQGSEADNPEVSNVQQRLLDSENSMQVTDSAIDSVTQGSEADDPEVSNVQQRLSDSENSMQATDSAIDSVTQGSEADDPEVSNVQQRLSDSENSMQVTDSASDSVTQGSEADDPEVSDVQQRLLNSESGMQVAASENSSATERLEFDDAEESSMHLVLSDSDCEILEHQEVCESKGKEAVNEEKKSRPVDSGCYVQITVPVNGSDTRRLRVISKKKPHSLQNVSDSNSDLEIIEENTIQSKSVPESILRDQPSTQHNIGQKKKFLEQKVMTHYFVRKVTAHKKNMERNEKELDDLNREAIAMLKVRNGLLKWSYQPSVELDTDDVLQLSGSDEDCMNKIRTADGDTVSNSANSVNVIDLSESSDECEATEVREKNHSACRGTDSDHSVNFESFAYLSQYQTIDEHECGRCGKVFESYENLRKHMSMDRTIICQYCNLSFKKDSELFEHLPSHDGKVKWSCGDCGEKSVRWRDVMVHIQVHRKSHSCKETFSTSKKSTNQGYPCKICGKRLPNKSSVRMHLLSHSEENKWVCPHCQDTFTEKESLVSHIENHNLLKY